MEEFIYKEYTEEETSIYEKAIPEIIDFVKSGLSFQDACERVQIEDTELKAYIVDDALKIVIAEMHFNQHMSLHKISGLIGVSTDILTKAQREMVQDVSISASEFFTQTNPEGHCGNA